MAVVHNAARGVVPGTKDPARTRADVLDERGARVAEHEAALLVDATGRDGGEGLQVNAHVLPFDGLNGDPRAFDVAVVLRCAVVQVRLGVG